MFYQLVKQLEARGEIEFEHLFVDGTKIETNANRYSFVWAKSVSKCESRLTPNFMELLTRLRTEYVFVPTGEGADAYLEMLKEKAVGLVFVHERGKRKTQLQRDIETIEEYLRRSAKYAAYGATFKGRNSFSKTDRDATLMRMKEDHMMNGQLRPGYNLQLSVEGEYIVGVDISSERSDELTLLHLLDRMAKGSGKRHKHIVADAGYET